MQISRRQHYKFYETEYKNKELQKLMDKIGICQDIKVFHEGIADLRHQYKAGFVPKTLPTQSMQDEEPCLTSNEQARGARDSAPGKGS